MGLYHQFQTTVTFANLIPSFIYTYVSLEPEADLGMLQHSQSAPTWMLQQS